MPRYVDAVIMFSETRKASEILRELADLFMTSEITFVPDSLVIFNDSDDSEREPESASSVQQAMEVLLRHPWLGGTQFDLAGQKLAIFFFGLTEYCVDAVTISITANAYSEKREVKFGFEALIYRTHRRLDAARSIVDSELLSPNSFWKEEVHRLRNSIYNGNYAMDLRREANRQV